ncbi:MAG: electron transfer flavoprotein subunit beta/FixA family protein [Eubacteriaceae bacterium]|jgi:electron transfer flavoprotein beta subunit|nr:electron transfer flavoprotein subunit beta/FixA family protein [Eubacteriaceae bacterium]
MKILVYIKQVPDTDEVKVDPVTGNLKREGVDSKMNPPDKHAVEAAIQLKEQYGGSVHVITMGIPAADDILKEALAMGCDESYLLTDRKLGGADTLATGYPLAKAAEKIGDYDLLLCGKHAVDAETAQTGQIIAEFLGIPQATLVSKIEIKDNVAVCERMLPDCKEVVEIKLPALLTVSEEINTPRYPSPINIMKALKKPRHQWSADDIGADPDRIGKNGSPSSNIKLFEPPKRDSNTEYIEGSTEEIVQKIISILAAEKII